MKRNAGFTLIELMIVVAIIGILAVIAIPNFLKFQCKAKQSEAKTNLSGIFTAEKTFFGEYNTFSTDLVSVNWFPDGAPIYVYGFDTADTRTDLTTLIANYDPTFMDTLNTDVVNSATEARYSTVKAYTTAGNALTNDFSAICVAANATQCAANDPASPAFGFLAGATGDIDTDDADAAADWDGWWINAQRLLVNGLNDCAD